MSSVDCQERVETTTKWCKTHRKKSYFKLSDCPLFFLFWPELPVLAPVASKQPLEEVHELCDLCGRPYNPGSLPVEGLQVGLTKVTQKESEDCAEVDTVQQNGRARYRVTFASNIAVESDISCDNGSGGEEGEKTVKIEQIEENPTETTIKELCAEDKAELPAEDEVDNDSDDEESMKAKKRCLPFKTKRD